MTSYRDAGVDIDAANEAVAGMAAAVRATYTDRVLSDVGSFGGLFSVEDWPGRPVLVASTDGVGTKVKLAAQHRRWRGIGHDLVNHCVNDILVQGARPLFFLDYVATARLESAVIVEIVTGIAEACGAVGCAVLGGETAEMPGVYVEGAVDVAGTIVGMVDRDAVLPRLGDMRVGTPLWALPSSGPHTNGYSLIRHLIEGRDLPEGFIDALLQPHRCYLADLAGTDALGLAHITGGGLLDNVNRVLPASLSARIELGSWEVPPLFRQLVAWGSLPVHEAYRTFNMGVGMVGIGGTPPPGAFPVGELVDRPASGEAVLLVP
ncbi:MAG: phosphoribosylformylglycinamidine cyclo-ligase [Acidimicrobiales bacterium]|nr:phosphoribosylformylglycinamidine cyclo-ligase [Acidimicrobiales bacterium]